MKNINVIYFFNRSNWNDWVFLNLKKKQKSYVSEKGKQR